MSKGKYTLKKVTIDQFAMLDEPASDKIDFEVSIPIKTNYTNKALAVGAKVSFLEKDKPFLTAEVFCHYVIDDEWWNELSEGETKDVILPKDFMDSLARIAIGTLRGALCAKTEGTPFANYCLPIFTINTPEGKGDFVIYRNQPVIPV